MRLEGSDEFTDHTLLPGQTANDHHRQAHANRILINATSIPGLSTTAVNVTLDAAGHAVVWGVIHGTQVVDINGYEGCFFLARDAALKSSATSIRRYGVTGYPRSYVGAYSRVHGDSYLTHAGSFGGEQLILNDAYISGSNLVLLVTNTSASAQNFSCYGAFTVK